MSEIKNTFVSGKMNKDLDERVVANGEYRDAMSIQISTSEGSSVGAIQNILGNELIRNQGAIPYENSFCVGSIDDEKNNDIYWLVEGGNSNLAPSQIYSALNSGDSDALVYKDLILKHSVDDVSNPTTLVFIDIYKVQAELSFAACGLTDTIGIRVPVYSVVKGMQIRFVDESTGLYIPGFTARVKSVDATGTEITLDRKVDTCLITVNGYLEFYNNRVLDFDRTRLITGINVIDDFLFWTDNYSEPKKINIKRSIEGTDPQFRPTQNGNLHTNLIVEDRDITNSNNVTPIRLEHITVVKKYPLTPPVLDLVGIQDELSGTVPHNFYATQSGNAQKVGDIWTGNFGSTSLNVNDVLILNPTNANVNLPFAHQVRIRVLEDQSMIDPNGLLVQAGYWKVEILSILYNVGATNAWDWMIQITEDEKIFQRRFPRFAYRYKYEDGEYSTFSPFSEIAFKPGEFDYEPKQAYNLGLQNSLTKVNVKDFNTAQIPEEVVQIDILYKETNSPNVYVVDKLKKTDPPLDSGSNNWDLNEYEVTSDVIYSVLPENQLLRSWDNVPRLALSQEITANRLIYGNYVQNYNLESVNGAELKPSPIANWKSQIHGWNFNGEKSVKSNREYNLGITYLDRYGRETPVFTNKDASIKMPFAQSLENNRLSVKNRTTPPSWAKYWKVYVKETSNEYYNMVMDRVYRAKDGNVWLSFPSSDRNKVDEETFLILKKSADSNAAVTETNKYKIIALKNEAPDFIKTKRMIIGKSAGNPGTIHVNLDAGPPQSPHFGVAVPCAELFDEADHLPGKDKITVRINRSTWLGFYEQPLEDVKEKLSLTFFKNSATTGRVFSQDYDVADFTTHGVSTSSPTGTHYHFTLEKPMEESWFEVNAGAAFNAASGVPGNLGANILEPTLGVSVYKYKMEHKPEFDGRFFAKIYSDNLIQEEIEPLITTKNVEVITGQIPVFYLSDNDAVGGSGTTGYSKSGQGGSGESHWVNNLKFGGTTKLSRWFIDETYHVGTVDNRDNGGILAYEFSDHYASTNGGCADWNNAPYLSGCLDSINHRKGVYEENGQWYIDLSFSQIEPSLHNGDACDKCVAEYIDNGDSDEWDTALKNIDDSTTLLNKFGIGTSKNDKHEDEREVVNKLQTGSKFKFSGDPSSTIYTITAPPDVTYHMNHTSSIEFELASIILQIAFFMNSCTTTSCMTNLQAYTDFENYCKKIGSPTNRRTTYKIPIDKNPNNHWNPTNGVDVNGNFNGADEDSQTNILFLGTYTTDTVNQLQSNNPAIWETEPKENVDLDIYYEASQAYPIRLNIDNNTQYIPIGSTFKCQNCTYPNIVYEVTSFDDDIITFDFLTRQFDANGNPVLPNSIIPDGEELVFNSLYTGTVSATVINPSSLASDTIIISKYVALQPITLGWTNCYSFGNGVESDRIRDDFNQVTIDNGAVASSTIEEPYEEERRKYGLIYSGLYNSISGVNNLNQFIQAEKITKDLNPDNGSIQKLHTRNTDLVVLCEDRVLRMLANKDAVFNADGNMQLTATSNVLGQAVPFGGEFGISKNPESFASESFRAYFTDKQRGAVLRLSKDGLTPISDYGMKDWFKDNLKNYNTFIGSYDNKNLDYNLTIGDKSVSFSEDVNGWVSFKSFAPESAISVSGNYYTFLDGEIYKHYTEILNSITGEDTNRNTFYGNRTASHVEVLLNESPGFIKSFNTLNYEGSQSRVDQFTSATIDGINYEDGQYHNLGPDKKGWYVEKIITDKQDGSLDEFIEKEGKWFNYIRGNELPTNASGAIIGGFDYDTSEFSWQGIGAVIAVNAAPILGCTDPTYQEYNSLATQDTTPTSCLTLHIYGCMSGNKCGPTLTTDCTSNFDCKPGTFPLTGSYSCNEGVTIDDGSCIILGCTQPAAQNYNPAATTGNSQMNNCTATIYGCTDNTQFNYSALANATCSGPLGCIPPNCNGPYPGTGSGCCVPIVFGCIDPTMFNYCPGCNTPSISIPCVPFIHGCTDPNANNTTANANVDDGSCTYDTHTAAFYINANYQLVLEIIPHTNALSGGEFTAEIFDPSGTFVIGQQTYTTVSGVQQFIVPCATVVNGNYTANVTFNWPNLTPVLNYTYTFNQDAIPGCTFQSIGNQSTTNYDSTATVDDCSCITCIYGCMDTDGTLNPAHTFTIGPPPSGVSCTASYPNGAINVNLLATCNDGSCVYPGCRDTSASNFEPCANADCSGAISGTDTSCCLHNGCTNTATGCYPDINGLCPGNGSTGNTIGQPSCNPGEGYYVNNFDPGATADCGGTAGGNDYSCCQASQTTGCTDSSLTFSIPTNPGFASIIANTINYNPCATTSTPTTCVPVVLGCVNPNALNHGSYAVGSGFGPSQNTTNFGQSVAMGHSGNTFIWSQSGANNSIIGNAGANTDDGTTCILPTYGCMDCGTIWEAITGFYCNGVSAATVPGSINFDIHATVDDGSCCDQAGCIMPNYFDVTPANLQLTANSNLGSAGCVSFMNSTGGVVDDCYGDLINVYGITVLGTASGTTANNGIQTGSNWGASGGLPVALNGGNTCADCTVTGVAVHPFSMFTNTDGWLDPGNVVPNPPGVSSLTTNWANIHSGQGNLNDCCIYEDGCADPCADNFNPAATGNNDTELCTYHISTNSNWCNTHVPLSFGGIHSTSSTITGGFAPWHTIHNCCPTGPNADCGC